MLAILNSELDIVEIWEADRPIIEKELNRPGSKARNVRGQMAISKFKSLAKLIWKNE
jgi:hypothetical protein